MPGAPRRSGDPSLLFVVGHPVSHSLSPAMHNGIIARIGLPLYYVPVDLPPGRLGDFLQVLFRGHSDRIQDWS